MNLLLILSGSIAAYKVLDLVRLLQPSWSIRCIMTKGAGDFVTPLSLSALSQGPVYGPSLSLEQEQAMGHIHLARWADLIVVVPASANMLARMAHGLCDDLAGSVLLASQAPVWVAPAMNTSMWEHPATQSNMNLLQSRGVKVLGPTSGSLACGEEGQGKLLDVTDLFEEIQSFAPQGQLSGYHFIVTAGPTLEAIDGIRVVTNRSSGQQGYHIAGALQKAGARVTLISGPVSLEAPLGVQRISVKSAHDMLAAVETALPAHGFIGVAAVSDWYLPHAASKKMKKESDHLSLTFSQTPDILATVGHHTQRPSLVVGFALETENLLENAEAKRRKKNCDWLVANPSDAIHSPNTEAFFLTEQGAVVWGKQTKKALAHKLTLEIIRYFSDENKN